MTERIILTEACIAEGAAWLSQKEPRFARAVEAVPEVPLRRKADGFAELLSAIVSQQVSVVSANAIWGRLLAAGMVTEAAIAQASDDDLRAVGLSRPKVRYAKALACAEIEYEALRTRPSAEVIETLTSVSGIGPWTAQIYAMFSLGRADVFAPGDLALQEAARLLFELPERPGPDALDHMAQDWSPWRAVAARVLWAYYKVEKQREGSR